MSILSITIPHAPKDWQNDTWTGTNGWCFTEHDSDFPTVFEGFGGHSLGDISHASTEIINTKYSIL